MNAKELHLDTTKYLNHLKDQELSDELYLRRLRQVFLSIVLHVSDQSQVQLTSTFSRLAYLISDHGIAGQEAYLLHFARRAVVSDEHALVVVETAMDILLSRVLGESPFYNHDVKTTLDNVRDVRESERSSYIDSRMVLIVGLDDDRRVLYAKDYDPPYEDISVGLYRADRNEDFYATIKSIDDHNGLPLTARLLEIEVDGEGRYHPSMIVIEPDYLYDVTSISECFSGRETHQLSYLLRRLKSRGVSLPITVGNIANDFLDQLLYDVDLSFDDIKKGLFALDPLTFATLDDGVLKDTIKKLRLHFDNLKRVVKQDLPKEGINSTQSYIEPAFYSARYGIQGRLDLLTKEEDKAAIVELKSGSPFMPNAYGLSSSHYHQTLLYDMIIQSVYGRQLKRKNFILYSKELGNNLRYAPSTKSQYRETVKMRNRLWLTDMMLRGEVGIVRYLRQFARRYMGSIKGFQKKDIDQLLKAFDKLSPVEIAYSEELVRFALREHRMGKLGDETNERLSGLASMWKDDMQIKKEQFAIINDLVIKEDKTAEDDPILILRKSEDTAELSNFRVGDLVVLYRDFGQVDSVLRDQVFKGTLLSEEIDEIHVRLRSRQLNRSIFSGDIRWHVEHDRLESGYYHMTRSVMELASSHPSYRQMIMGVCAPQERANAITPPRPPEMTDHQYNLYQEIINAQGYHLLWGPPGTGKTSVMTKNLVQYYQQHTDQRILLLSYTNRAVDELCHALRSISDDIDFVRIGSRYSTGSDYVSTLLDQRMKSISTRSGLIDMLKGTRIYVGTVASMIGKPQLFEIVDFDLAIVDEASQILDTSLIGLLSRVKKFVLVGDHLQLPAVVLQRSQDTRINDEDLMGLGITSTANSLFERLYKRASDQGWDHVYGQLSEQGRMHEDLMAFSNDYFYKGSLHLLPGLDRLTEKWSIGNESDNVIVTALRKGRMVYIPTERDWQSDNTKVNMHEVRAVVAVIKQLTSCIDHMTEKSIGVITPYRAQIASIVRQMQIDQVEYRELITVDTVERYQGGARDIIIMSATTNMTHQLRSLVSPSEEGIDRKLNVAFTRAKEQFILIGNEEILSKNEVYAALIALSTRLEL